MKLKKGLKKKICASAYLAETSSSALTSSVNHFSSAISSISSCGFIFTRQAFSGERYGKPLFPPLTCAQRTTGATESSLIISQAGSVPQLYLSGTLIRQEWKAALRGAGEERCRTNQKTAKNQYGRIRGHTVNANWHSFIDIHVKKKEVIMSKLKRGFHWGPVIFNSFAKGRATDQKSPCVSPRVVIKDLLEGSQQTPPRHEGERIVLKWKI